MRKDGLFCPNEESSLDWAKTLARVISAPLVIGFSGDLGAGKTCFIRGMLRELGIEGPIKSPTYALVESYDCKDFQLHHFDLYRLSDVDELEMMGFRDFFEENAVLCIEWPRKVSETVCPLDLEVILHAEGDGRRLHFKALRPMAQGVLEKLRL